MKSIFSYTSVKNTDLYNFTIYSKKSCRILPLLTMIDQCYYHKTGHSPDDSVAEGEGARRVCVWCEEM